MKSIVNCSLYHVLNKKIEYLNILLGEGGLDAMHEVNAENLAKDLLGFEEVNDDVENAQNDG